MKSPSGIDSRIWLQHAWRNRVQSLALLIAMGSFLALLGWLVWGPDGVLILAVIGIVAVIMNPAAAPRWVMRLYGAHPIPPAQAPQLWSLAGALAARAQLPTTPTLYYVPSRMLNAFAVGAPNQAAIAVTDGLLRNLTLREVAGVLAHEISHVRSNDLWVMGLAGSSRQGCESRRVQVPLPSVARERTASISPARGGNEPRYAGT